MCRGGSKGGPGWPCPSPHIRHGHPSGHPKLKLASVTASMDSTQVWPPLQNLRHPTGPPKRLCVETPLLMCKTAQASPADERRTVGKLQSSLKEYRENDRFFPEGHRKEALGSRALRCWNVDDIEYVLPTFTNSASLTLIPLNSNSRWTEDGLQDADIPHLLSTPELTAVTSRINFSEVIRNQQDTHIEKKTKRVVEIQASFPAIFKVTCSSVET
jgi:hypothetical protein